MAVEDNHRWAVFRQRDRRRAVVGYLDAVQIDALRLTGALTPFGEDATTLIWSGPAGQTGSLRDGSALRRPDPKASARRRKPIEQVLDALNNDRDRLRARNAGLRLTSDIQRAMSPQSVTMRWDAAGAVDGSRKADRGGGSISAAAAKRQLITYRIFRTFDFAGGSFQSERTGDGRERRQADGRGDPHR